MKKVVSLVLVVAVMLSSVGLVACGGGEGVTPPPPSGEAAPPAEEAAPPPSEEEPTPPPAEGLSWNDMPVYSGAKQVTKGTWTIPPAEGEWSKVEWRYYETGDSVSTVVAFYKSQMPGKGWQEMAWMEMEGVSWGYYSKNDEQDEAMVWTGSDDGKTFIALMRATQ